MKNTFLIVLVVIAAVGLVGFVIFSMWGQRPGGPQSGGLGQNPQYDGQQPSGQGSQSQCGNDFCLPTFDTNAPLVSPPEGQWITKQLGDVEIRYFSTSIVRGMSENGADFFITLKNKGLTEANVNFSSDEELAATVPQTNLHFYSFQNSPVKIPAGGEKKLWYFVSLDHPGDRFVVDFAFWLDNASSKISTPVTFGNAEEDFAGKETSVIYGYVKDENGNPVANARVDAMMNCGRMGNRGDTDGQGRYVTSVMGMEDVNAIYGSREMSCDSFDYFVSIAKDGYEYYFKDHVAPTRKDFIRLDITLEKKKDNDSYSLKWEKKVDDNYGFFWVKPSSDWTVFAADQAKHPPELNKPTNIYLFDSNGNILWKQPTENECWGIDIASDGKVAAGCHDKNVYAVDKSGKLLWEFDTGGMVRSVCFSRDGKKILSGPIQKLYLFNSADGTKQEVSWIDEWFRNCAFYWDDSGLIAGARTLAGFDSAGNKKWEYIMGEFPMFLAVDQSKNTFAAGKSRTLFSFDSSGNLRWKHRIPDHVVTAGSATPDGSRIVLGTIGGMVYLFDNNGNVLWKRNTGDVGEQGGTVGHNAIAISSDGKRIVAGTAPGNCVITYNEKGTVIWKGCSDVEKTSSDMLEGVTNVHISGSKDKIVASYGDNYIREFILQ